MRIGIIGSGNVGVALANGLKELGHEVMVGTNTPDKQATLEQQIPGVKVGDFTQSAEMGEVVIFAVKGSVAEEVLGTLTTQLNGKVVIDTTNPISDVPPTDGVLGYFTDHSQSLFERLQTIAPQVKLVKALNSVGAGAMVKPQFESKPTMFICGEDVAAKETVSKLLDELGWETADMGKPAAARAIEPLCMLWCIPGMLENDWTNHAFKLLKK